MSHPLTAQILTQSSITMLVRVLAEDNSVTVNGLEIAVLGDDSFGNRRERVRVAWEGDNSTGQHDFVLYGLPSRTWSETVNPNLPAPAPVLLVESDLPDVFTMITEGFVASGRRRGERPAWLLREDWTGIKTIEEAFREQSPEACDRTHEIEGDETSSNPLLAMILAKTAAFHALHWGAEPVLDDVYPWLPRFSAWVEQVRADAIASAVPYEALLKMIGMPTTIIHGSWRADHLRLHNGELLADGWDRIMVGPAAWDIYSLLDSLDIQDWEPRVRQYCQYLQELVTEFKDVDAFVSGVLALRTI